MRLGLVLLACLATAACGGPKPDAPAPANGQAQMQNPLLDADKEMTRRWGTLFDDPAAALAAAKEFGYETDAIKTGPYRAESAEQVLPDAKAPVTVKTRFTAAGAAANRVDAVTFTFQISDMTRKDSRELAMTQGYPSRIVRGFLGRFEVSAGDDARNAIEKYQSGSFDRQGGGTVKVDSAPLPALGPNARSVTVTIFKTGAPAPAQS